MTEFDEFQTLKHQLRDAFRPSEEGGDGGARVGTCVWSQTHVALNERWRVTDLILTRVLRDGVEVDLAGRVGFDGGADDRSDVEQRV